MIEEENKEPTNHSPTTGTSTANNARQQRPGRNPERKRHGARNQHRHQAFVKWLLDTFPAVFSKKEDSTKEHQLHICDVAGGKGEVSARLCMCHLQQVVMVDPRPADIVNCYETLVLPKIPNKWQCRLEEKRKENPNLLIEMVESRFCQLVMTFDEDRLAMSEELRNAVNNSSLILGLHADGATEAIVDAALQYVKPFVIVPCCVFPNLFTSRQIEENGKMVPVRSHEQFCRFLVLKDKRFRMETLPFEGRNVAIWWDGK
jgi:hypothetical protein